MSLDLHERRTNRQIENLLQGKVDVGIVHAVPLPPELESHPLGAERLVCCVLRHHQLAGRGRISISEVAGEKVIVFAREFAAHYHGRIVGLLRATLRNSCALQGTTLAQGCYPCCPEHTYFSRRARVCPCVVSDPSA